MVSDTFNDCQTCGTAMKIRFDQIVYPMVLVLFKFNSKKHGDKRVTTILNTLTIGEFTYKLSGCVYGDNFHFVSLVRDFTNDTIYFYDGMKNNGQFTRFLGASFPGSIGGYQHNDAYYIRTDMCKHFAT